MNKYCSTSMCRCVNTFCFVHTGIFLNLYKKIHKKSKLIIIITIISIDLVYQYILGRYAHKTYCIRQIALPHHPPQSTTAIIAN